ncbi:MAG: phosphoenolpyruvate--protein phosphotransferase [Spirochaetaceae bacterium]|jgi:phosphotransferase system enzyme I (PtsP)|nr:phosphoenolpyruvate--protein phosphotransferase [Spirochaetaceae bacterium]
MKTQKDDIELICSVGELSDLFNEPRGVSAFLQKVVDTVSKHMHSDVCSIYLFNEKDRQLTLEATRGLNPELIGNLQLSLDEGLVGITLKRLHSILEQDGRESDFYKAIDNSGEETYKAFLAVPILRGLTRIGVLAVQHHKVGYFDKKDSRVLKAIASQLATTLENARMLTNMSRESTKPKQSQTDVHIVSGTAVGQGVARGRSFTLESNAPGKQYLRASSDNYLETHEDFKNALAQTEKQLKELQQHLDEELSDMASMIFSAHILMLKDESFSGEMENLIQLGTKPHTSVLQVVNRFVDIFSTADNSRLQEKVQDVKDLGHRLLLNLSPQEDQSGDYSGQVVIAQELLPSELIKLSAQKVEGLILFGGGASAHISILAASLGINLIYTDDERVLDLPEDLDIILDGNQGNIIIEPDEKTSLRFDELLQTQAKMAQLEEQVDEETRTACGRRIDLLASINLLSDIKSANRLKADGIGLYRSEFPFLIRNDFPTEEEQFRVYHNVTHDINRGFVTLRTLDIGGDKILSYVPEAQGDNPFLGLRALRFLLKNKKIFVGQLKAMLRAGEDCDLRIMFPLVSSLDDFLQAKTMVEKSMEFLDRDGLSYNAKPKLGVMIELPSAVFMVNELAMEADFMSIGTNDLVQYLLGVDRTNSSVASLFQGEHPAVLKAINQVVQASITHNCHLSMCGNLTKDKRLLYIFVGMGIKSFSVAPQRIPMMQAFIGGIDFKKAQQDAEEVLKLTTTEDVITFLEQRVP